MKKILSKVKLVLIGAISIVMLSGCSEAVYHLMRGYSSIGGY